MRSKTASISAIRLLFSFVFASALGFAGTWSGTLVDARCVRTVESNRNVTDSSTVRDVNLEVRLCSPKLKTHSFAILDSDGESATLDPAGNTKAAELVSQVGRKSPFLVTISGEMSKNTIDVQSISPAR